MTEIVIIKFNCNRLNIIEIYIESCVGLYINSNRINSQYSSIAHIEFEFHTKFITLIILNPVKYLHIMDQIESPHHKENIQSDFQESIMSGAREI